MPTSSSGPTSLWKTAAEGKPIGFLTTVARVPWTYLDPTPTRQPCQATTPCRGRWSTSRPGLTQVGTGRPGPQSSSPPVALVTSKPDSVRQHVGSTGPPPWSQCVAVVLAMPGPGRRVNDGTTVRCPLPGTAPPSGAARGMSDDATPAS